MVKTFGEILRDILTQKRVSQKYLALHSKLTEASISHYIKGDRIPKRETMITIARVLDISPSIFFGSEGYSSEPISFQELKALLVSNVDKFSQEEKIELVKIFLK